MSKELTPKTGQFDEIISIIDNARTRALKAVNAELIQMYWNVGEYLSSLCANSGLVIYKRGCYSLRFSFKMKVIG